MDFDTLKGTLEFPQRFDVHQRHHRQVSVESSSVLGPVGVLAVPKPPAYQQP